LRSALAFGVALAGLTGFGGDAEAFHAVKDHYWYRRPMANGDGGCRVPYTENFATNQVRDTFYQVVNYVNTVTTCRWEPKQSWDADYVDVTENGLDWDSLFVDYVSNAGGIGRRGVGRQELRICHGCNTFNHILHEMGHSMGLFHEHQHPDRDTYLQIFLENVRDSSERAFDRITEGNTTLGFPYERWSVMHYDGYDFMTPGLVPWCAITGCRTMKFWSGGEPGPTEQFTGLELMGLKRRYPVPARLTAMHSGKCVDIPAHNAVERTIVEQFDCHDGANQGWLLRWQENIEGTDYYLIETADPNGVANSGGSGLCLDVQSGSQTVGAPIWLWPCTGAWAQQWALESAGGNTNGFRLRARHSGQYLSVFDASQQNSMRLLQWLWGGSENQIWGLNFRPEVVPIPPDPCVPGQRSICEYDVEARRMICECMP
jgi:hypothetical protein